MKKGFIVTLLMVAVVAMAFPVSAMAPIIKDLPDIVIGDTGDISGSGTTAKHLYKYLNALNLFDSARIDWRNDGFPSDAKHAYIYRNATTDPINIQASKATGWTTTLSDGQYTALVGAGTIPPAATNVVDGPTTFGWLSVMNRAIETGSPANAYAATAAANGLTTTQIAALSPDPLTATDLMMVAYELPDSLPLATSLTQCLSNQEPFTVYTLTGDDYTSGDITTILSYTFDGGSRQNWFGNANAGSGLVPPVAACPLTSDGLTGAIGFDGTGGSGVSWGVWKLSDDGANAKFMIPAAGMEGLVLRARCMLSTEAGATKESPVLYRIAATSLFGDHWSGVFVPSIATGTGIDQIDMPAGSSPLEAQIHWAVPYDLNEWDNAGGMAMTNWGTFLGGNASAPADGRDYCLEWDGADAGDTADLYMDSCIIEAYPRPATQTAFAEWGTGHTSFLYNATTNPNGFEAASAGLFGLTLGTSDLNADHATATMGTLVGANWMQISPNFVNTNATLQRLPEVANSLNRYTVTYNSGTNADIAPNIRFQCKSSVDYSADQSVWYDNLIPYNFVNGYAPFISGPNPAPFTPAADELPGTPKTEAAGGSTIDIYHYTMNTNTGCWRAFYWDVYGAPMAGGWASQTGSLSVTNLTVENGLSNP